MTHYKRGPENPLEYEVPEENTSDNSKNCFSQMFAMDQTDDNNCRTEEQSRIPKVFLKSGS